MFQMVSNWLFDSPKDQTNNYKSHKNYKSHIKKNQSKMAKSRNNHIKLNVNGVQIPLSSIAVPVNNYPHSQSKYHSKSDSVSSEKHLPLMTSSTRYIVQQSSRIKRQCPDEPSLNPEPTSIRVPTDYIPSTRIPMACLKIDSLQPIDGDFVKWNQKELLQTPPSISFDRERKKAVENIRKSQSLPNHLDLDSLSRNSSFSDNHNSEISAYHQSPSHESFNLLEENDSKHEITTCSSSKINIPQDSIKQLTSSVEEESIHLQKSPIEENQAPRRSARIKRSLNNTGLLQSAAIKRKTLSCYQEGKRIDTSFISGSPSSSSSHSSKGEKLRNKNSFPLKEKCQKDTIISRKRSKRVSSSNNQRLTNIKAPVLLFSRKEKQIKSQLLGKKSKKSQKYAKKRQSATKSLKSLSILQQVTLQNTKRQKQKISTSKLYGFQDKNQAYKKRIAQIKARNHRQALRSRK